MRCPYCSKEIQGIICPECHQAIPRESRYCLYCGAMVKEHPRMDDIVSGAAAADDFDFENRIPCSDGTCIGIIVNGKCNICGKRQRAKKA
jgi:hypothetical protein